MELIILVIAGLGLGWISVNALKLWKGSAVVPKGIGLALGIGFTLGLAFLTFLSLIHSGNPFVNSFEFLFGHHPYPTDWMETVMSLIFVLAPLPYVLALVARRAKQA